MGMALFQLKCIYGHRNLNFMWLSCVTKYYFSCDIPHPPSVYKYKTILSSRAYRNRWWPDLAQEPQVRTPGFASSICISKQNSWILPVFKLYMNMTFNKCDSTLFMGVIHIFCLQQLVYYHAYIAFPQLLQFIYPFCCWWTFGVFPTWNCHVQFNEHSQTSRFACRVLLDYTLVGC